MQWLQLKKPFNQYLQYLWRGRAVLLTFSLQTNLQRAEDKSSMNLRDKLCWQIQDCCIPESAWLHKEMLWLPWMGAEMKQFLALQYLFDFYNQSSMPICTDLRRKFEVIRLLSSNRSVKTVFTSIISSREVLRIDS